MASLGLQSYSVTRASLVTQRVKKRPAMQETQVVLWVGKILWRWEWPPTPVLPGESMDRGAWQDTAHGFTELDTTE